MRLQIDTKLKTIKIEESINFAELIETLNKLLPKGELEKYTLETNTVINWAYGYPYYFQHYSMPLTLTGINGTASELTVSNCNDTITNVDVSGGIINYEA